MPPVEGEKGKEIEESQDSIALEKEGTQGGIEPSPEIQEVAETQEKKLSNGPARETRPRSRGSVLKRDLNRYTPPKG